MEGDHLGDVAGQLDSVRTLRSQQLRLGPQQCDCEREVAVVVVGVGEGLPGAGPQGQRPVLCVDACVAAVVVVIWIVAEYPGVGAVIRIGNYGAVLAALADQHRPPVALGVQPVCAVDERLRTALQQKANRLRLCSGRRRAEMHPRPRGVRAERALLGLFRGEDMCRRTREPCVADGRDRQTLVRRSER